MDAIRDALATLLQIASQQIDQLDDDTMNALTHLLTQANARISQLKQDKELGREEQEQAEIADQIAPRTPPPTPPTGGPIPPLEQAPHESSNINAFRYDPSNGKLFVKFQDKFPGTNGPVYSYEGVPKNIFEVFRRGAVAPKTSGSNAWHTWKEGVTPSHGAAMYALIREGNYPYQRIR